MPQRRLPKCCWDLPRAASRAQCWRSPWRIRSSQRLILPAIVTTQTLPVFAIAPLVVIWFGFGMPSKVFMAALITFFPVASAFHDGLSSTRREWLDLARGWAAGDLSTLLRIRVPAALPSLATGLKVAATLAPIGAIVGEWAGASAGLGYVMLQANARLQTDMVFACLVLLAAMAWLLRAAVALAADRIVFWKDSLKGAPMRLVLAILAFALASGNAAAADKVTVLLDWFVNPDHAALVIAKETGMFEKAGLDVELIAPADPSAPPRLVAAGQGDLAVTYQPQLHVQVGEGLPLVRIATIAETPLNALVVLKDGPVKSIADLKGKTVGFSVGGFEDAVLAAMLKTQGLSLRRRDARQRQFRALALAVCRKGRRGDRRVPQFRAEPDGHRRPGRAPPSIRRRTACPPMTNWCSSRRRAGKDEPAFARLVGALEEATLWLTNHPGEAWEVFVKAHPDLDNELNRRAWRDTLPRLAKRPAALDRGPVPPLRAVHAAIGADR